jgi:nucleoside 2-deoxyribosyltransferase
VFPLDTSLDLAGLPKHEAARRIALANEALIRSCDGLIANMTPFRGAGMDAGTAYEIGFARALGKPVFGYTNTEADYQTRAAVFQRLAAEGRWTMPDADAAGIDIEDFDLTENLMLAVAVSESGTTIIAQDADPGREMTDLDAFKACVAQAAVLLGAIAPPE